MTDFPFPGELCTAQQREPDLWCPGFPLSTTILEHETPTLILPQSTLHIPSLEILEVHLTEKS